MPNAECRSVRFKSYPVILAYHRVAPTPDPGTPTVTPATFERQIAFVCRCARVLTLKSAVREWLNLGRWPERAAVITFDDGDGTTHAHAWPVLQRLHAPATVFMIAGNVDRPNSLTRAQLAELADGGIEIGSHTVHHAYLPSIPADRVADELRDSKRMLAEMSRSAVETLSYPAGGFSSDVRRAAQEAGYFAACTTNRALPPQSLNHLITQSPPLDRWALRRIKMTERTDSPWLIRAKLSGYYDNFRRLEPAC